MYPCAVVAHADAAHPRLLDFHANRARASIQAILKQFLDDRCGPLNDLACGDLVGHEVA